MLPAVWRRAARRSSWRLMRTGAEVRVSTPVSIARTEQNPQRMQSINTPGLYPAGEGAGYAGGIMSAAIDGIKVAEAVALNMVAQSG
jgi:uncharacterized FAD-dependent dehydrogenase